MAYKTSGRINLHQNRLEFQLDPINQQSSVFQYKLFEKMLDPIKGDPLDPNNQRIYTIKYFYQGCG